MPAGSKPGERRGGRKPGSRNKATTAREKRVSLTGITPLDVMIKDMRFHDELVDKELAKARPNLKIVVAELKAARSAATDAAPYVHPKLATLQSNVNLTGRLTLEQLVETSIKDAAKKGEKPE